MFDPETNKEIKVTWPRFEINQRKAIAYMKEREQDNPAPSRPQIAFRVLSAPSPDGSQMSGIPEES